MQKGKAGGSVESPPVPHAMIANAPENDVATPTRLPTCRQSLAGRAKVAGDLIAAAEKSYDKLWFWAMPAASMMPQSWTSWNR
jgi:hypothetical protein